MAECVSLGAFQRRKPVTIAEHDMTREITGSKKAFFFTINITEKIIRGDNPAISNNPFKFIILLIVYYI